MKYEKNIIDAVSVFKKSASSDFGADLPEDMIRAHIESKDFYAIYDDGVLVGAYYYNGNDLHMAMTKKGKGAEVIRKITKGRNARAVIDLWNTRVIRLCELLGFEIMSSDGKQLYMVKSWDS